MTSTFIDAVESVVELQSNHNFDHFRDLFGVVEWKSNRNCNRPFSQTSTLSSCLFLQMVLPPSHRKIIMVGYVVPEVLQQHP